MIWRSRSGAIAPHRRSRFLWLCALAAMVIWLGFLTAGLLPPHLSKSASVRAQDVSPLADVLHFGGPVSAVAQAPGDRWIFAGMGARLAVIDAALPENPRLAALLPLGEPPTAMVLAHAQPEGLNQPGSPAQPDAVPLLFVAAGTAGVAILSVARPDAPTLLSWIDTDWFAFDIAFDALRERLVVADGGAGLAVYDVSDPAAPLRLGTVDTPSEARAVALDARGLLAYVADWGRGMAVIDLQDPAAPRLVGGVDSPGEAVDVVLDDGWVYLADREGGLAVIEVADPTTPRFAVTVEPARAGAPEAVAVDPGGERVYLADGGGGSLRWLRRTAPGLLAAGGSMDLDGRPVALDIPGGSRRLAVANARLGLQLLDRGEGVPQPLGLLYSPSFVEGIALDPHRGLAFLADAYGGVLAVDPGSAEEGSNPPILPRVVGRFFTGAATHDLALFGRRAYVADSSAGLRTVDISDPTAPRDLGTDDTPGEALGVDLDRAAGRAYLADGPGGLRIYDIAAMADGPPRLLGQLPLAGFAWSLRVDSATGLVFLADRLVGLRIIDVRNPALPRERAVHSASGGVFEVALSGDRAYIAAGQGGLRVLDVSDPDHPREVGGVDRLGTAQGLALLGSRLFMTAGTDGLRRLDLRDPDRPRPDAAWTLEGLTERIAVEDGAAGRIFVACEWGGLAIVAGGDGPMRGLYLPWSGTR